MMKRKTNPNNALSLLACLLIGLLWFPPLSAAPLSNQLKNHASPYLALHGNDPVQWQDWGEAVIREAQKTNKLIFLSSGYFSCHWCHVMQRESYSDAGVAKQLHQLAIPVKIDRELQPALDAWLIDFTERTAGQAGWPLNVFLTPDGYPLVGLTYLPKDNFSELLGKLQQRWSNEEELLRTTALNAFEVMKPAKQHYSESTSDIDIKTKMQRLQRHALQLADDISGGFGDQNKFPMSPQLLGLLESLTVVPNEKLQVFLTLTLDNMANLGLYDRLGGGFYRYVVDPGWEIPHFEKMLYDNALLARVYLRAAKVLNQPDYIDVAKGTLDFVLNDMAMKGGGYAASLSAVDDKDVEGGYYLWHLDDLHKLLNKEEFDAVATIWDVQDAPDLEDGYHLRQVTTLQEAATQLDTSADKLETILSSAKTKLLRARAKRNLPIDNKVLASWNGLLLTALSEAAIETNEARYKTAANKLYQTLTTKLWDGKQMHRFIHNGKPGGKVSLGDYAYVAQGALAYAQLSNNDSAYKMSRAIIDGALQTFHNANGWQFSESLLIPYNARELILADDTLPSSSAVLLETGMALANQTNDSALTTALKAYLEPGYAALHDSPLWYAGHINTLNRSH